MRINSEKIVSLPQILYRMADLFAFTYEEKKRMAAQTAEILEEEIGLKGEAIEAVYLIPEIEQDTRPLRPLRQNMAHRWHASCTA